LNSNKLKIYNFFFFLEIVVDPNSKFRYLINSTFEIN